MLKLWNVNGGIGVLLSYVGRCFVRCLVCCVVICVVGGSGCLWLLGSRLL